MGIYELRFEGRRRPSVVHSNPGETPKDFLRRLIDEHATARTEYAQITRDPARRGKVNVVALHDAATVPPLRGANIADLLRQAREQGDAAAITPAGRLRVDGLDLTGVDLEKTDFSGCDLSRTTLTCANLTHANLIGAALVGADLSGVRGRGADFTDAKMAGCKMMAARPVRWAHNSVHEVLNPEQLSDFSDAYFSGADLSGSDLRRVAMAGARLNGTCLDRASLEDCDLTDAVLGGTSMREAVLFRNKLHIELPIAAKLDTTGARMMLNSYFVLPNMVHFVSSPVAAWRNLRSLVSDMADEYTNGTAETRADLRQNVMGVVLAGLTVTAGIGGLTATAGPLLGLAGGAAFVASRTPRTALKKAVQFALSHLGGVCEALEIHRNTLTERLSLAGAALFSVGKQAKLVADEIRRHADPPMVCLDSKSGIFVLDSEAGVRSLLGRLTRRTGDATYEGYLDDTGALKDTITVSREVGGAWPDEDAPSRVVLRKDGSAVAWWTGRDGRPVIGILYDAEGHPKAYKDGAGRTITQDRVSEPAFLRQRAAFEDLKTAVVQTVVAFDAHTHRATVSPDGSIIIRDISSGRADNRGGAAVVRPDGTRLVLEQGATPSSVAPPAEVVGLRA